MSKHSSSIITTTTLPDEKTYRSHPAVAQSRAKYITRGIKELEEQQNRMNKNIYRRGIAIGSVVDWLLTQYEITTNRTPFAILPKPPSKTTKLGKTIALLLEGYDITDAYDVVGHKQKSLSQIMSEINQDAYYWKCLQVNDDKIIIDDKDYDTALEVYQSLMTHPYTRQICKKSYEDENLEAFYQLAITTTYRGLEIKALLDKVIVDHKRKLVQPLDFKTTELKTTNFSKAFYDFKYNVQAYWYTVACRHHFRGYKILPFQFVVESTRSTGTPLIYTVSSGTMRRTKREVHKIIDLYKWHQKNGFKKDKHVVENNGLLRI